MASVTVEEYELLGDPKYRAYISAVDKALKNFESTTEWADLISALGKLNKVLITHLRYAVIPRRIVVSKRLAQCLHPNLPSGVHLKALETYDILFKCIGTNRLSQELFIYSAGLFPLLGNAAMNVRPALLNIYETHFAPLATRLRPALSGFLTGVLSGLEEGSEYHDRTNSLLEKVCEGVKPNYFYGCTWECVLANPNVRLPAILFVTSHFNKKKSMEDQLYIIGTNVDILIQALCAAVQDTSVLVQRSVLDLFLMGFPMHNSQLIKLDMEKILTAAVIVVLRRDMSLNRRLWSWLLGTEANTSYPPPVLPSSSDKSRRNSISSEPGNSNVYFDTYSKDLLINALRSCLKDSCSVRGIDVRPYRILISLFDKPEVSSAIVEDILIEVFRTLYKAYNLTSNACETEIKGAKNKSTSTQKNNSELLKTANLLFGTFEPFYIWEYVGSVFLKACDNTTSNNAIFCDEIVKDIGEGLPSIIEMCELIEFLLEVISVETYIETQTEHLPELLLHLMNALILHIEVISSHELTRSLRLCVKILSKVQPPVVPVEKEERSESDTASILKEKVISETDETETPESPSSSHSILDEQHLPVEGESTNFKPSLERNDTSGIGTDDTTRRSLIHNCMQVFQQFFVKFVTKRIHDDSDMFDSAFDGLIITNKNDEREREQEIEALLMNCLNKTKDEENDGILLKQTKRSEKAHGKMMNVEIVDSAFELADAYSYACKMMVELSSFPMYWSPNANGQVPRRSSVSAADVSSDIPQWLKVLMVSACCLRHSSIQLVSVSTLLDLINITQSVAQETKECEITDSTQGNVAVIIVPMLEISHWNMINKNTYLYQVIAEQLWNKLGDRSVAYHRQSAHLLNQLHGLAPSEKLVEDVICQSMAQGDEMSQIESFRRFAAFWHFLRDLPVQANARSAVRMYDRCLFMMLDCLQTDVGPQRTEVQSWFSHSLQRGDISRIVEPILLVLLHPDTARVSVQHISIQQPKKVRLSENIDDGSTSEAKIYAISSVEGHVFYHVADESRKSPSPTSNSAQSRRVFALTCLTDEKSSEVITANAEVSDFDLPSSHEYGIRSPILLFVNPIGGMSWTDDESSTSKTLPDFKNARRIDTTKLDRQRAESSFDAPDSAQTPSDEQEEVIATSSTEIVKEILEEMIDNVCQKEEIAYEIEDESTKLTENDIKLTETSDELKKNTEDVCVHPLHTHLLLYCQVYDSKRVLYALNLLRTIIQTNPRLVLSTLSTSSLGSSLAPRLAHLQCLLARHRRSVFGKGFHTELPTESVTVFRSSMLLEVFISVCLYFIRGLYPNLAQMRLTNEEISGNREVQLAATEVLTLIFTELVPVVKDSGRGFASYIRDLLNRCRVQKALLHCLLSNVYAASSRPNLEGAAVPGQTSTFTEVIIDFNEVLRSDNNDSTCDYSEAFQICMLRLLLVLIILEAQVCPQKGEEGKLENEKSRQSLPPQGSTVRYIQGMAIPCQPMFLSAVICAIKQNQTRHLHQHWLALITASLPYLGRALSQVVIVIISQLCHNLESLSGQYKEPASILSNGDAASPIDYVITILDGLTTLCHYCLLDTPLQVSMLIQPSASTTFQHPILQGPNAGQIINNLINVFTPSVVQKDSGLNRESTPPIDPLMAVRRSVLSHLSRIVSSLSIMWQAVCLPENSNAQQHPCWIMGTPKVIKQRILEFLSPITHHHGVNFLTAVSLVWNERKKKMAASVKRIVPPASEDQEVLVNLVNAIKVMPIDILIQTVKSVVKQTPATNLMKSNPIEVSILQFFFSYIQTVSNNALIESWPSLLSLFKEGLQLPLVPPAHFLLLAILNEFVQKSVAFEDKKDQKDLQDIAQKLIEAVSNIGGACLEQTTWLRRSLAVKSVPQLEVEGSSSDLDGINSCSNTVTSSISAELDRNSECINSNSQYSVQALSVLAELVAPLLDVIYVSDEKEKVVPLLNNVMYNVTPYLKNHSQHNIPSFRACSQLLANLSSYQYTRKAWRRDTLDLLLDASFFQMTETCLKYWQTTVDNLMTHDKVTFRDLLYRIPVTQSGSLNLFSSREQEYEQRAQLLKRLSFVIFSGEVDQYQNFMPDIQERLTESLRLPQVPLVQSQVFLCFRVLLVRMSPQHITSLWPIIITEMVTVFLQIEQELNTDSEEFRLNSSSHLRRLSTLDSSWVVSPNNGLNAHNHPAWLQLYLSVCKLLDLTLTLPADRLPQFQMYRWAFVGDIAPTNVNNNDVELSLNMRNQNPLETGFVPHITRLAYLLSKKLSSTEILTMTSGQPLLTMSTIRSLLQLQPFFNTLVTCHGQPAPDTQSSSINSAQQTRITSDEALLESLTSVSLRPKGSFVAVEKVIQKDFLESLNAV